MKNKICDLFIFACITALVGLIILLCVNAVSFNVLWFKYSILGCLLIIGICLNVRFKKYTDLDEARALTKRTRKSLATLKTKKELSYVKRLTVINQLTNTELILEEFIATHETYGLKDNLSALKEIKTAFKGEENSKQTVSKETVDTATEILDGIIAELREL